MNCGRAEWELETKWEAPGAVWEGDDHGVPGALGLISKAKSNKLCYYVEIVTCERESSRAIPVFSPSTYRTREPFPENRKRTNWAKRQG